MVPRFRQVFGFQESGLVLIVVVLGVLLAACSGSVRLPEFARGPDGIRHRVFTTDASGARAVGPTLSRLRRGLRLETGTSRWHRPR